MNRTPSIQTLRAVFGDNAPAAKRILQMNRAELEETEAGRARIAECWHAPATWDLRMHALDALAGTHGVEGFRLRNGCCEYLNAGDTYAPTLLRVRGHYRVGTWGDIAERHT
jgi:hypothetical protein